MSLEAIKFKKENPNLDYKKMNLKELNKLPLHNGVLEFKITETSFLILNILNDDSSVVKYFWYGTHDLKALDLWYNISKEKGTYIDIGAHTGLYTLAAAKSNQENFIISIEPYYLNLARLITNLRLNNITKNINLNLAAASNYNGVSKFKINTDFSYLSKGGTISAEGDNIKVIKIDSLDLDKSKINVRGIKIDTEGEDFNVLLGAQKLIEKFRPKIIVEVRDSNKHEIQNFFKDLNYTLHDISDTNTILNIVNINIKNVLNIYAKPM